MVMQEASFRATQEVRICDLPQSLRVLASEPKGDNRERMNMNRDNHRERHVELHKALDELFADFITHSGTETFTKAPIISLIEWSHAQTIEPDHEET